MNEIKPVETIARPPSNTMLSQNYIKEPYTSKARPVNDIILVSIGSTFLLRLAWRAAKEWLAH